MVKIGLISDTHGDYIAWNKALLVWSDVDLILHAGDVLYHGPRNQMTEGYNPQKLVEVINSCKIPIIFTRGNCDSPIDMEVIRRPFNDGYSFIAIGDIFIMVHHGDRYTDAQIKEYIENYGIDVVVSGHTHVFGIRREQRALLVNPGSPSIPKGSGIPTVGVIENRLVKILDMDGNTLAKEVIGYGSED